MAKKKDTKKAKAKTAPKQAKKVAKPAPKKAVKPAAKKSAPKPVVKKKKEEPKKVSKQVSSKTKTAAKKVAAKTVSKKAESKKEKEIKGKKPAGKPIDAIVKKAKDKKADKSKGKKKGKSSDDDEDDVDVKDDYEKNEEEEETIEEGSELDVAGLVDLDAAVVVPDDDDDDEVPEKRGRGRRKKNEGKSMGGSMEQYIRNRPVQIDITKQLVRNKNANDPKPFVNTKDNRTRYTDKELAEFKELILQKLKEAQTDYDLLKQTMSNEDDNGTDDTSPSFKLLEDGSDVMSKEETAQLAVRQEKYIVNLKNALVRIENKSYGICRITGKLIPKERLRSVPHATLGIDAKLSQTI